jgi:ATP-binding cassette subfamily F protein uup
LESKKAELSNQLNSGITDHTALEKLAREIDTVSGLIERKTMRWLELSELAG